MMKSSKQYIVKVISTGKQYDEKYFFKIIFESLNNIKNLSSKSSTDEERKEKIVIA